MEKKFGREADASPQAILSQVTGVAVADSGQAETSVHTLPLRRTARSIAANSGNKGAIVITLGKDGIHVAADGLNPEEVREALCTAIHASFLFDEG
jgi:hypothetical protein